MGRGPQKEWNVTGTLLTFDVHVVDGETIPVPAQEVGARFSYPDDASSWSTAFTDGDGCARFRDRHPQQAQGGSQTNGFRQRVMHKAICADCNTACEVPFRPTDGRPVYCKECFAKRKAQGTFKPRHEHDKPGAGVSAQAPRQSEKVAAGQGRKAAVKGAAKTASKAAAKKKPAVKKRKGKK